MRRLEISFAILTLGLALTACGNGEGKNAAAPTESHEGAARVVISRAAMQASAVKVEKAGAGPIRETLSLSGRIVLQPSARAEIHAPYPGPVRAVLRSVGDNVKRGETLARVESAESLQTYSIASPIAGIVLERATNVGDVSSGAALFVVGDISRLQAELNVGARDISRVRPGAIVVLTGLDGASRVETKVQNILPSANVSSQTLTAFAPLPAANSAFRPGVAIRGDVVVSEQPAQIVAPTEAVQTYEGRQVVFVQVAKDTFEARPVVVGRSAGGSTEITAGLAAGEAFVSENAFLVKAELGKSAAEHE